MIRGYFVADSSVSYYDFRVEDQKLGVLSRYLENEYVSNPRSSVAFCHFLDQNPISILCDWRRLKSIHHSVVTLVRPNQLRRYISLMLLERRGWVNWASDRPRESDPPLLTINLREFYLWSNRTASVRRTVSRLMGQKIVLRLTYDDLIRRWDASMGRLCKVAGVPWDGSCPSTFRQETRSLPSILENWKSIGPMARKHLTVMDRVGS